MLTIDLEPELETTLNAMAQKEHSSPAEIIKQLINRYIKEKQESGLLIDIVKDLPEIACFKDKDPLELQSTMRDEASLANKIEPGKLQENKRHFLALIKKIEPVKTPYSSEEMVAMLREGKEQLLIDAQTNYGK